MKLTAELEISIIENILEEEAKKLKEKTDRQYDALDVGTRIAYTSILEVMRSMDKTREEN